MNFEQCFVVLYKPDLKLECFFKTTVTVLSQANLDVNCFSALFSVFFGDIMISIVSYIFVGIYTQLV